MTPSHALAALLREGETPISAHVVDPAEEPGSAVRRRRPRAAAAPAEYALVVEAVREGYLLHYGEPRLLAGHDADLALLAGDYLYALGIERLAALGDAEAILVLADLISGCARLHAEDGPACRSYGAGRSDPPSAIAGCSDGADERRLSDAPSQ